MKRAPVVLAATAAGLAAVLSYHTRPVSLAAGAVRGSSASPRPDFPVGPATPSASPASGRSATSGRTSGGSRSATGAAENYSYGVLSVRVTADGKKITSVSIASFEDDGNPRSVAIDDESIPILEREAVQAQTADIQGVSGASFTSAGFKSSLQSALSKLGLP